jgi:hypothetical protein
MSSPKHPRKKRSGHVNIAQYNAETRERNIKHEIRLADKKLNKLLKRNTLGKMAAPGKKMIWDDSRQNIVKVIPIEHKQGFKKDSERYNKLVAHIQLLSSMLK